MSSSSRNSRKLTQAVQLACAAALLAGSTAFAADQAHTFELTAFSGTAAGDSLVHGQYENALARLAFDGRSLQRDSVGTNRCVAYIAMHELPAAHAACDDAIRDAQRELAGLPLSMTWARADYRDYLAVAYSNRAVLKWMSNDIAGAQADLKKAAAVAPKAEFVARNLSALESHNAVAQVKVVTKS